MSTNTANWGAERPQEIGFVTLLSNAVKAVAHARTQRRTQMALAELDDHALLDIGVNPGDVRRNHRAVTDWVLQSHSGTARLIFIGR